MEGSEDFVLPTHVKGSAVPEEIKVGSSHCNVDATWSPFLGLTPSAHSQHHVSPVSAHRRPSATTSRTSSPTPPAAPPPIATQRRSLYTPTPARPAANAHASQKAYTSSDGTSSGVRQYACPTTMTKKKKGGNRGRAAAAAGKIVVARHPRRCQSSTLDSDAAPLDSAAIESHATKRAEEEAARAERRARRRERKERKSAALALALEHAAVLDGNAEFEGFPGSGGRRPPPASPFARSSEGDYRDDDDDDEGDFGAGAYARRTRGGSDSGRGSDSRSRTSTSLSSGPQQHGQPYNHHYISQQPSAHPAVPPPAVPPLHTQRSKKGKSSRSSASKTSSSSRRSRSSPSASQSPSLASPVATQFLDAAAPAPRTAQEFEGFSSDLGLHTAGIERLSSGFPSPGIGGRRNGKRDMGAFLANRGDA
ncbi:hypothetical protein EDB92DRAFT_1945144 [Lactarius akahatsu]|uniref:Uncharacterized protein n=1 Tax=Lactarius akahatsu TaxID=416441 RepID=A0AAD4QE65_9AGAM|nr:hypothetical protein EDB92DRAFT_1945144 [Lactarius akahatsu]